VESGDRVARDRRIGAIVVGVVVAVIAVWVTVTTVNDRSPEDVVEEFLTNIAEKDVDGALALVTRYGYGVPYGDGAAFLTPEAIDGNWWVASVTEVGGGKYSSEITVKAVIAGPGGSAEGTFTVQEDNEEWLLSDPFVKVRFPPSPLSFVRVNGQIVPRETEVGGTEEYTLFPGLYRFYQPVEGVVDTKGAGPVLAFPEPGSGYDERPTVVPAALTPGTRTVEKLRQELRDRIDSCVGFATPAPAADCPFATDGEIDTPDGRRVSDIRGLTWTVGTYPEVTMADDRTDEYHPGFALRTTKPGTVTLTGSGTDTEDQPATFTVTCAVDLTGFTATVDADGGVAIAVTQNRDVADTCRQA